MMHRKKTAGFTLVEILIAVAVISILATIALPLYDRQVQKARRTDGRAALSNIALAQERFYTVNGSYTTNLANLDISSDLQGGNSEEGYYTLAISTTNATTVPDFTITGTATSAQSGDSDCTAMNLTHLGVKGGSPANNLCW